MRTFIVIIICALFLIACSNNSPSNTTPNVPSDTNITQIIKNLNSPWSINKSGDIFFISEREGTIAKIENDQLVRQTVHLEKNLSNASEAGLLGFILAPSFQSTGEAFAYYTYEENGLTQNRVISLSLKDNQWYETSVLIDNIPSGTYHHGGRLKLGPDETLYITTGDASNPYLAQELDSLAGKILRLNLDGSIPQNNPYENSPIYSLGHRNPQGLTWNEEGQLFSSEHGPNANDEINTIYSGINYGWPHIVGNEEAKMLVSHIFTSGNDTTWAPSGMSYWNNNLYVAALRGQALLKFDLRTEMVSKFVDGVGRVRDVLIDGDDLYFITNNTDGRGNPSEEDDQLFHLNLSTYKP